MSLFNDDFPPERFASYREFVEAFKDIFPPRPFICFFPVVDNDGYCDRTCSAYDWICHTCNMGLNYHDADAQRAGLADGIPYGKAIPGPRCPTHKIWRER